MSAIAIYIRARLSVPFLAGTVALISISQLLSKVNLPLIYNITMSLYDWAFLIFATSCIRPPFLLPDTATIAYLDLRILPDTATIAYLDLRILPDKKMNWAR